MAEYGAETYFQPNDSTDRGGEIFVLTIFTEVGCAALAPYLRPHNLRLNNQPHKKEARTAVHASDISGCCILPDHHTLCLGAEHRLTFRDRECLEEGSEITEADVVVDIRCPD